MTDDEAPLGAPTFLSTRTEHYAPGKPVTYGFDEHGVLRVDVFEVSQILGLPIDEIDSSGKGSTSLHPDDLRTFAVLGMDEVSAVDTVLTTMTTLAGLYLLITQATRPANSIFIAWVTYILIPNAHSTRARSRT